MKWPGWLKASITHPVLGLLLRVYVGGVFIYASMYKINYPGEFAETIASYQLVPYWAVNFMALVMPWAELVSGILMVLGVRTKSAAAAIGGMLVMFSLAISDHAAARHPHRMRVFHISRGAFGVGHPRARSPVARHDASGLFFPLGPAAGRPAC